ncbi:MAG TPA: S1 RNA-binding domain-containing protein, partial [Thermoanaerobaculia bacterium]|nr:S1 RNA-binding domain-containing protein [Thermoanaerobaculia bacterium]
MAEQHHPSHEPQGTDHQEEEQQQLAQEAPETHEPPPSQATAEPQSQPAAAAEPQPAPAATEPPPQEVAAESRPSQAGTEPGSQPAGAEQAAHAAHAAHVANTAEAPPEKRDFAEILAEFEQGKSGAERAGAPPDTAGATAGAAAAASGVPATPNVGQKVSGKVLSITGDQVFVDLGTKSEGMIEAAQLRDAEGQLTVKVGDSLDAIVTAIDPESG